MNSTLPNENPVPTKPPETKPNRQTLVVMDHHEARIFRSDERGAAAEQIRPHQTDESISHTDSFDGFSRGQEKPALSTFFGPISEALKFSERILVFGGGTGTANEMNQFVDWLKTHRPEIAGRIVDAVVVDAHHLTDNQLLALAREFHSKSARAAATSESRDGHPLENRSPAGA